MVRIDDRGDAAVITFTTSSVSDVEGIAAAGRRIRSYIAQTPPKRLVFDFAGVKFFSSQVLGLLLDARTEAQARGGEVVISSIDPQLHRVFKITSLDKVFEFFPDRHAAAQIGGPAT